MQTASHPIPQPTIPVSQSSDDQTTTNQAPIKARKRCYYQVMNVLQTATPAQIKTSYKKLALQLHPDKSKDPNAKQRFVQVQQAYKILSDVNQRTWYDNHKEQVLYNKHEMTTEEFDMQTFGFDLEQYMNVKCFKEFTDAPGDFFAVYRKVFELVKEEEKKAYERSQLHKEENEEYRDKEKVEWRKMPGFADSNVEMEDLKKFYQEWETFSTFKNFCWADQYNLKEAQNRYERREMEKENKAERVKEKKRYIQAIKDLVNFVKKRDPRIEKLEEYLKDQEKRLAEQKKRKAEQDRLRRIQREQDKKRELQEIRLRMEAAKTEEQKEKERLAMIEKPKIVERREKLVKHQCPTCLEIFKDFNKHFHHVQKTGHAKN